MQAVTIKPNFEAWRDTARQLLSQKVHPRDVLWSTADAPDLFQDSQPPPAAINLPTLKVPRAFLRLAETTSCHRSGKQWALLYQILWTLTQEPPRDILQNTTHPATRSLEIMRKAISRDIHKMRAFVRFRQLSTGPHGQYV
ncbi:MAG: DUF4130 domain-containing protein, partial [Verrucomicrobiales bacterium]